MKLHLPKLLLTAVMATFALVQPVWADWGENANNDDQRNTYYVTGNIAADADWKTADSASSDTTIYLRADEGGTAATIGKLTISDSDKLIITGKWDGSQNFSGLKLSSVLGDADNTLQIGGSQATAGEQIVTIGNSGNKAYTVGNTIVSAGATLIFGASNDILNFDSNDSTKQSMTVAGTLDLGTYRQTLGQGFTLTLNSGTVTGSNQKGSAGDDYGGLDLNAGKTGISIVSTGTSTISSGLRLRNNTVTIAVQDGTLTIDDIVQGGQEGSIGHVNKTGSGKLIISASGAYNEGIYKGNTTLSDGGTIEFAYDKKVVNDTEQVLAYGGTISGTGNIAKSSTGAMTIAKVSGLDGDISVSGGSLTITTLDVTKTIDISVSEGAALTLGTVSLNVLNQQMDIAAEGTKNYYTMDGTNAATNGFYVTDTVYYLFKGYQWDGQISGATVDTTEQGDTVVSFESADTTFFVNEGTHVISTAGDYINGRATGYVVEEGATLKIDGEQSEGMSAAQILKTAEGDGNITVDCNFVFTNGSSSKAKGTLTIEEGHTLQLGQATTDVVSIASFNQVVLNGSTLKLKNNGTTIQNLTVDKASTLHIEDTGKTANGVPNNMHLTGVTTLNAELDVTNGFKGQLTIDSLTGTGNLDIDLANNGYVHYGDCLIVNINEVSNYSGIISYKPAVNTDANNAATHANNRITITSTNKGFSVGGLEVTGGVLDNRTASGAATIDIGGDASLGAVKLGQGSSLTIFNRKAAGASNGIHTVTMDSLAVDGSAMIQTQRNANCFNGTINIGNLTGTDATLTLKNGSQTDDAKAFNINGGSYAGTINLEADSAKGQGEPNRKLHMYVNNATALQSAVINFQDPSTATATDKDYNYITFGVGIDNAKVAGITGTTTKAAVIKSTEGIRSLEINVAENQKYASNAKIENSINLVKSGAGEQAFSSDMSAYTGAVKVSGGNLALTNEAEGANTTLTSLTLDGGALNVTGTLTLSNVTVDLSKYTAGTNIELVTAGTLSADALSVSYANGATTAGNYTGTLAQDGNSLWLTWKDTTTTVSSITTSVSKEGDWYTLSTDGTTTTLTLTVDGSLAGLAADGSVMVHLLTDKQLSAIMGDKNYNPYVLLELTDSDKNTVAADDFNKVVFIKGETGQNYWGEMVDFGGEVGTKLAYNVERIPEPASATLSLAALMMLCARRRRQK